MGTDTFRFRATLTAHKTDKVNWHLREYDVPSFVAFFLKRGHPVGTKDGFGIIAATFKPKSRLQQVNLQAVTGLILDFDGTVVKDGTKTLVKLDPDALISKLPFEGMAHTSYSSTPEYPRFRVILPLEETITMEEHHRLWWYFFEQTDSLADRSGKNPDRMFYLPRRPGDSDPAHHWVRGLQGARLSMAAVPASYKPPEQLPVFAPQRLERKQGMHASKPTYAREEDGEKVLALFMASPLVTWATDDPSAVSREAWRGIATQLAAIANDNPDIEEACCEAFHQISAMDEFRYQFNICQSTFYDAQRSVERYGPLTYDYIINHGAPASIKTAESQKAPIADVRKQVRKTPKRASRATDGEGQQVEAPSAPTPTPPAVHVQAPAPLTLATAAPSPEFDVLDPANFLFHAKDERWYLRREDGGPFEGPLSSRALHTLLLQAPYSCEKRHIEGLIAKTHSFYDFVLLVDVPYGYVPYHPRYPKPCFNMYKPPLFKPVAGPFEPYQQLILNLVEHDADAYEYVMDWLAAPLQSLYLRKQTLKMRTALVFEGEPGSGKGTLEHMLRVMYGDSNTTTIDQSQLDSKFNDIIRGKLMVLANEVMSSTNRSLETANKLKTWVTDPYIKSERKFGEAELMSNEFNIIFTSNDDRPVYLEKKDRRFSVFHSVAIDEKLAGRVYADLGLITHPGPRVQLAGFYNHLLTRQLKIRPGTLYTSQARSRLIERVLLSDERFALELSQDGWLATAYSWMGAAPPHSPREPTVSPKNAVLIDTLHDVYAHFCKSRNLTRRGPTQMRAALLECFPDLKFTRLQIGGIRMNVVEGLPMHAPGDNVTPLVQPAAATPAVASGEGFDLT